MAVKSLAKCRGGVIVKFAAAGPAQRRLVEMGATPGTRVDVLRRAPMGDPVQITMRGYTLTIRGDDCADILVDDGAS